MKECNPKGVPTSAYNAWVATEILAVQSRRAQRRKRGQEVQHFLAAGTLIWTAIAHLRAPHGPHGLLPGFELLAGIVLIVALLRERFSHREGHHQSIGFAEIAGAAMMFVEAVAKTREPHHLSFLVLSFLVPVLILGIGMVKVRANGLRYLKIDEEQLEARLGTFSRRRYQLCDLEAFCQRGEGVDLTIRGQNQRRIVLNGLIHPSEAVQWIATQLRARGVTELPAEQLPGGQGGAHQSERNQELVPGED